MYNRVQKLDMLNEFLLVLKYKRKVNFKGGKKCFHHACPFMAHLPPEGGSFANSRLSWSGSAVVTA